jgi:hypothetical protein
VVVVIVGPVSVLVVVVVVVAGGGGPRERSGEMPSVSESESSGLVGTEMVMEGVRLPCWDWIGGGGRKPRGWGGLLLLVVGSAAWLESSESQLNRGGEVVMMRGLGGWSRARPRSRMGARGGGGK